MDNNINNNSNNKKELDDSKLAELYALNEYTVSESQKSEIMDDLIDIVEQLAKDVESIKQALQGNEEQEQSKQSLRSPIGMSKPSPKIVDPMSQQLNNFAQQLRGGGQ